MKILSVFKYLLVLPFILLVFFSVLTGVADIMAYQSLRYEKSWLQRGAMVKKIDWEHSVFWSQWAIRFNPYNPNYREIKGRLYFWRFFLNEAPVTSHAEAQAIVNTGLQYFRDSIELRPTWPIAWASLLQLKSMGGQLDYDFEQAWDRSIELGDWEPEVQALLLEASLMHWENLNHRLQEKAIKVLVSMISKPFSEDRGINVVHRQNAWPAICQALVDPMLMTQKVRAICRNVSAKKQPPSLLRLPAK